MVNEFSLEVLILIPLGETSTVIVLILNNKNCRDEISLFAEKKEERRETCCSFKEIFSFIIPSLKKGLDAINLFFWLIFLKGLVQELRS